jgi:Tol biopolymer transport system component
VVAGRAALVVLALSVLAAAGPATTALTSPYRIVFGSACYDGVRPYTILPDGSGLTPLAPVDTALTPLAVSADGSTIAYRTGRGRAYTTDLDLGSGAIYVSRADGSALRRLVPEGSRPALSRDGKRLVFVEDGAVWIVGTDGRGLRRLAPGPYARDPAWSPDGTAVVFDDGSQSGLVVQPLHGKRRELAKRGGYRPSWSPDGRWIAYDPDGGLTVVRPDGTSRHRVGVSAEAYSWSPDGRSLALVPVGGPLEVVGVDGRGLHKLKVGFEPSELMWSPDGRQLALGDLAGQPPQLLVVGRDGQGLRHLTSACWNTIAGWTALAPSAQPAPPSERLLPDGTVATRDPVTGIAADGASVAFIARSSPTDCEHPDIWAQPQSSLRHLETAAAPCRAGTELGNTGVARLALAGTRVVWESSYLSDSGDCRSALWSESLDEPHLLFLANAFPLSCRSTDVFHLRVDDDLPVFDDGTRLVRIGTGSEKCAKLTFELAPASICTTLSTGAHACCVDSVSGGLIAIREPGAVALLDEQGKLVRLVPFVPSDVSAARLDGVRLVVWRFGRLEVYDVGTGARQLSRPMPIGYRLQDAAGGNALLMSADAIMLLRLADGRSFTITPGRRPISADLEQPGLFYSYTTDDGGGRVVFVPASELTRRLDQGKA